MLARLTSGKAPLEGGVVGEGVDVGEAVDIVEDTRPDRLDEQVGEAGIRLHQPAPHRDAVGLVVDAVGEELVEVAEHRFLHQLGVERRDAVHLVRADEGELAHANAPAVMLVDERQRGEEPGIGIQHLARLLQEAGVDLVDDLHVARQEPLHQPHRPAFERLGKEGVVGVADGAAGDRPGGVPRDAVEVDENAHQLGDRDRGMGIVELDRHLVGKVLDRAELLEVAADEVLERGGDEEILLAEAQLLAGRGRIRRIEDAGDGLRPRPVGERADMVAAVELVEADLVDGAGAPQAKRVHPRPAPADDGRVVGDGEDLFLRVPALAHRVAGHAVALDAAAEADVVGRLAPFELPEIAVRQPVLGQLDLSAVLDFLVEEAVDVADAVAVGRDADRRHAFHEAGGETAETAIAEGGVGFERLDRVEVDAEAAKRLGDRLDQAEIGHRVAEKAADQELDRQVVDPLGAGPVGAAGRFHPSVDRPVADDEDRRRQPVVRLGDDRVLADRVGELVDDLGLEAVGVDAARLRARWHSSRSCCGTLI